MKKLALLILLFSATSALGQSLLTDPSSGCQFVVSWNCDDCTMSWSGNCKDSMPDGKGNLVVSYQSQVVMKYEGSMKNGQFDGYGTYQDGMNRMEGYFKNNNLVDIDPELFDNLKTHPVSEIDTANINTSFSGSDKLFYYAVAPTNKPSGALVLLPSYYEQPEQVLNSNAVLIKSASDNNVLVIVPTINSNLCLQQPSVDFLNQVFSDAITQYNCPEENFIVGGFSLGGMNSLRYTELAFENENATRIKPLAVFAVDPPVDYVNLYNREVKQLKKDSSAREAKMILDEFHKDLGNPTDNYDAFVRYSIYSNDEEDGGNVKYLTNIPVRVYCDPDIDWWMKNRNFSFYGINALDISAMILRLWELGNNDAEFINALGKGYRENDNRHPHSWSLIDPEECMAWILKMMD